jgi:hypothetical protein
MADAISSGVNVAEVVAQTEGLEKDFRVFKGLLQQEIDEAVEDTAEQFRDEVQNNIKGSRIDSDTGELLNSWKVKPKGLAQYEVRSTADHAVFLELGTQEHTITGDGWLKFMPEDTSGYPERNFNEDENGNVAGDFYEDGLVVSDNDPLADADAGTYFAKSVQHPGNDAYRYFEAAYRGTDWKTSLNNRVRQARDRALRESGLK